MKYPPVVNDLFLSKKNVFLEFSVQMFILPVTLDCSNCRAFGFGLSILNENIS
jgi:hypothetical protein